MWNSELMVANELAELKTKETVINFLKAFNRRKVEIPMLKSLAFRGIPSQVRALRPLVWKVLIGYLPRETADWLGIMQHNKKVYEGLLADLIVIPDLDNPENNNKNYENDHPLSVSNRSLWHQFFRDNVMWQEIEKDIRRTRVDMHFFTDAYDPSQRWNRE